MAKGKVNGSIEPQTPAPVVDQALQTINNEQGSQEVVEQVSDAMFLEDAGPNEFGKEDLAIPFFRALQDGSPQVKKREPTYIEGAEAGMFFNTVTGEIYTGDPGVVMIPVAYTPSFTEWKPKRGGFVRDHGADASIMLKTTKGGQDDKEDVLENGNVVSRAGLYYVFLYNEVTGAVSEVAFSLSSTGLSISRKWNTMIRSLRIPRDKANPMKGSVEPAMFYMSYRVKTFLDHRDAGDFFSYEIKPYKPTVELGPLGPSIYLAAREFKKMIGAGSVQVKHEAASEGEGDKEVPF